MKKVSINWTPELVNEAKALREQGKSYKEIATVMNHGRPNIRTDGKKFTSTNAWYACTQMRFTPGGKKKRRPKKMLKNGIDVAVTERIYGKTDRVKDVAAVFDLLAELLVDPVSEKLGRRLFRQD